jgi:GTP-binding protein
MLCNQKGLARTSATPGKTQTINLYRVNEQWTLADLPGYGFAKVSKRQRHQFSKLITDYIEQRSNLVCTFVLIDSRVTPQEIDLAFVNTLGEAQRPFVMAFTKTDKVSKADRIRQTRAWAEQLKPHWAELPMLVHTSAVKRTGREALLAIIEDSLGEG